ncbi:undecaprenyldiphospho-muramoylpentapeptide beta-N-acetylglucosaminyltransferase [Fusobacterium sp. IOR10]|uniref:undecaprenyldiphospho-muramoylpentapeptide beta-N-acetylglucosaminyltransferase n=1 Tax=Fusobacterium sp. IOR10 TaxID=2665157 RepID=UPI0013D3E504|nr:undecaprenyldiphospho-muramoylpentapeptide beta-N-acetylglucosaminyltransferase [Fusobacterium sp. IOR10]
MKKVIITTGGTGGHIYPALSVAKELRKREVEIIFVGSSSRMEKEMVPREGFKYIGLNISPLNSFSKIIKLVKTISKAIKIINKEKPDAVIGFGNYISFPIVFSAILMGKKVYLQEQNASIGLVNKLFYRFVKKTFLAFEKTYEDVPIKYQNKFKVTGNPLREEIYNIVSLEEKERLNIKKEKVILITGGSLGAQSINEGILKNWHLFIENPNIKIYWATGKNNYDEIIKKLQGRIKGHVIKPYFDNMISIMSASDLVICRAGALTISELIELNKPSILIPFNSIKVGQYENAIVLKERDGAIIYSNKDVNEAIEEGIELLKNSSRLDKMKLKIRSLKHSNATINIVESLDIWGNK